MNLMQQASIFVKAQHLRRVTTKVLIRIRIRGGLPTVPHTPSWQERGQLDSNLISQYISNYEHSNSNFNNVNMHY